MAQENDSQHLTHSHIMSAVLVTGTTASTGASFSFGVELGCVLDAVHAKSCCLFLFTPCCGYSLFASPSTRCRAEDRHSLHANSVQTDGLEAETLTTARSDASLVLTHQGCLCPTSFVLGRAKVAALCRSGSWSCMLHCLFIHTLELLTSTCNAVVGLLRQACHPRHVCVTDSRVSA